MRIANEGPAFSVLELLVVLSVIGVLVGLLLPAIQNVRGAAARTECLNNLRQIGLGAHGFHDRNGRLPPLASAATDSTAGLGWMVDILPDIEQDSVYRQSLEACAITPDPWQNPPHTGLATVIRVYTCPTDARLSQVLTDGDSRAAAYGSYLGIGGVTIRPTEPAKRYEGLCRSATWFTLFRYNRRAQHDFASGGTAAAGLASSRCMVSVVRDRR